MEEAHFSRLYLVSRSFGHDPKFMAIGEIDHEKKFNKLSFTGMRYGAGPGTGDTKLYGWENQKADCSLKPVLVSHSSLEPGLGSHLRRSTRRTHQLEHRRSWLPVIQCLGVNHCGNHPSSSLDLLFCDASLIPWLKPPCAIVSQIQSTSNPKAPLPSEHPA
ncbi:hypothetical protein CHARACLAT_010570 [Characodon lateralis]|uniref:Uncharacterized protein n=1 Tax=Characodon lateralis TaxID=208331 RepID=A0ABU7CPK1_9TELE|nr:hypothetical protein [Characodon lateralis]